VERSFQDVCYDEVEAATPVIRRLIAEVNVCLAHSDTSPGVAPSRRVAREVAMFARVIQLGVGLGAGDSGGVNVCPGDEGGAAGASDSSEDAGAGSNIEDGYPWALAAQ
jgi:hypothetical protein